MTGRRRRRRDADASRSGVSPRTLVAAAASALILGAALTAIGDMTFGPALDLLALGLSVYAAHRVGRLGPDAGTVTATATGNGDWHGGGNGGGNGE